VYAIGASLFARITGYVAAFGVAFYPPLIYLSGVFYAEQLFTILLVATVFCLVKWWQTKRLRWVAIAGIGLGLGALCRPVFLGFVPFAAAYVGWIANAKLRWRGPAVLLAVLSVTIAPWTIRNAMTFGHFVPVSTGFGLHLWRGNNDASWGDADDRVLFPGNDLWKQRVHELPDKAQQHAAWANQHRLGTALLECELLGSTSSNSTSPQAATSEDAIHQWDLVKADHSFIRAAVDWMAEHPADVLRLSGLRLLGLYSAFTRTRTQTEDASPRNQIIAAISFYPVLAMGLIGAVIAWYRQRASVVLHVAIVAGTAVYLLTTACTRFRLPLDPLWILLASVAVTSPWRNLRGAVSAA
jgi:4-amino-4-deoxy-L-arabinose transferase-like glycosyltransferase